MFRHFLSTALRHFLRHKVTTVMNVLSLALGLVCFMVAWGTAAYFGRADEYHSRAARTFFITNTAHEVDLTMTTTPWLLAEHLRTDFPQLEAVGRLRGFQELPLTVGDTSSFAAVAYADPDFLRVFDLPFVAGNAATALERPRSAVVSEDLARRLFGTVDVVGRTIRLSGSHEELEIGGVVGPIPRPSHLSTQGAFGPLGVFFEALLPIDLIADASRLQRWGTQCCYTYVVLPQSSSLTQSSLNEQMDAFAERTLPEDVRGKVQFRARPIGEFIETSMNMMVGTDKTGISSTRLLEILGGLVLLVACLNYANLATAQAATRAKEVAMRRVVGANRKQVALQHFFEGALLTCAALIAALICVGLAMLSTGSSISIGLLAMFAGMPGFWVLLFALALSVSFASTLYPALVLSRVRPAHALRGARVTGGPRFVATLLVGLQFASASFLLIAVLVIGAQNKEMKRAALGNANDPVIIIANDLAAAKVDRQVLKSELLRNPGTASVSSVNLLPWRPGGAIVQLTKTSDASAARQNANHMIVDLDFFETMQIRLIAGRSFDDEHASDTADVANWQRSAPATASEYHVVIEEKLARSLGLGDADEAVGKVFYSPTSQDGSTPPHRLQVIGVSEEATLMPLNLGYPSFYLMNSATAIVPVIRVSRHEVAETLAGIDSTWAGLAPDVPLRRRFGDEQYERSFRFLSTISTAFGALAAFASLIAALGLVGMALHVTARRTHEIGVRKSLGASVGQILWMLLRSFSRPVVIANLAVWPLVYLAMRGYLSLFAHRAGLSATPFLMALVATVAIAWIAVIAQASRAARVKPATVLRYE